MQSCQSFLAIVIRPWALLLSAFCFVVSSALAQETKLKKVDSHDIYEEYSVLVSDKKIKHGRYTLFRKSFFNDNSIVIMGNYAFGKKEGAWINYFDNPPNQVMEAGQYSDDLKSGSWVTYYPEARTAELRRNILTNEIEADNVNNHVSSTENYVNGKPTGTWKFYSPFKELVQAYDFDKDSLLFDSALVHLVTPRTHRAKFIGGDRRLRTLLEDNFDFHDIIGRVSKMGLKTGILRIEISIDGRGSVTGLKELANTFNNDKVIKRAYVAVNAVNDYWLAGYESDLAVPSTRVVKFILNQTTKYPPMNSNTNKIEINVNFKIEIE